MYSKICVEWAVDHFGPCSTYIDPLLTKIRAKNDFYIVIRNDLDLLPLDLLLTPLLTLIQRYVSTKIEISTAFLFRENQRHVTDGRTDGRDATLNAAP